MGILTSNKYISSTTVECGGEFQVTLALSAAPDLANVPADMALLIDVSNSVSGAPLTEIKASATRLLNVLSDRLATGDSGLYCCGNRAAVVTYATDGTVVQGLTDDPALLQAAVDSLTAGGNSNLSAGITAAADMLNDGNTGNRKVMFIFTDGRYNAGADPAAAVQSAKDAGIILYFIAVRSSEAADLEAIDNWATSPSSAYVITDFDTADGTFDNFLTNLGNNGLITGSTGIAVTEEVSSEFTILSASAPTMGTVTVTGQQTLTWNIPSLGTDEWQGAALTFNVRHTGNRSGEREVDASIAFTDNESNEATFNNPVIMVDCGQIVYPEPCPEPVDVVSEACEELITVDAGTLSLGLMGRIAQVSVTLANVCPGVRVALAVVLTELDDEGTELQRGMRTLTIPAHNFDGCRDIRVECINFVLPEDTDDTAASACGQRMFRTRVYANVIDSGVLCCNQETPEQ
ncbi:MAG: VWA domain-containing protein [Oscillospiraceae bacterium]|nr:VWA domain-containing protein [Oscillospiraceae bacterium]